jgi:predicted nicotinamide N-methyase
LNHLVAMTDLFVLELDETTKLRFLQNSTSKSHSSTVWSSGVVLAKWIWYNGIKNVQNMRAIDIGSGLGPVGLAVARKGCKDVTLTDLDEKAIIARLQENADLNEQAVTVAPLDWTWTEHTLGQFDLITSADTLFALHLAEPLAKTLASLSKTSSVCLVAYEHRDPIVVEAFHHHAKLQGFSIKRMKVSKQFNAQERQEYDHVEILKLKFIGR